MLVCIRIAIKNAPQTLRRTPKQLCCVGVCFQRPVAGFEINEDKSAFHARGEDGEACGFGGAYRKAGFEVDVPPMEGAYDGGAGYDAVTKWPRLY